MANNIVVIGAVIHLGAAHAAQTFAPNIGQQAALVDAFEIDQEATLLKAKAVLLYVHYTSFDYRPYPVNSDFNLREPKKKSFQ